TAIALKPSFKAILYQPCTRCRWLLSSFRRAKRGPVGWPIFLCARPSSRLMISFHKAEAMNEEDREWGLRHGVQQGPFALRTLLRFIAVGSEVARKRAGHRPPLKLYVRISRIQLLRRLTFPKCQGRYQSNQVHKPVLTVQLGLRQLPPAAVPPSA